MPREKEGFREQIEQLNEEEKIRYLTFLDGLLKSQAEQERFHDFEGEHKMKFRTFQRICRYIAMTLLIGIFGIVGGVQHDTISLAAGIVLAFADLCLTVFFACCGGMFYGQ